MEKNIEEIIQNSAFKIENGRFVYVKVSKILEIKNYFMVSRDADEITVVTKEENLSELDVIERNKDFYKLVALNVSVPFYSVGFLATISRAISESGMNILIVSTYSKDYIMVKDDMIDDARLALIKVGLKEIK